LDLEKISVGPSGDRAVAVGAIRVDAQGAVAIEDFGRGVAEGIRLADGDDGEFGLHGFEKCFDGGCLAAVVWDFERVSLERRALGNQRGFHFFLDVTGEHEIAVAVGEAQDQGIIVVRGGDALSVLRPQHAAVDAAKVHRIAGNFAHDGGAVVPGLLEQGFEGRGGFVAAQPQLAD